jgi:nucleoside-diphosphate-sugar epimerase
MHHGPVRAPKTSSIITPKTNGISAVTERRRGDDVSDAPTEGSYAMRLLLVGSSGLVGQDVLAIALADPRVTEVMALVRRPLPEYPKLRAPMVNFERLPDDADWWRADAVICTLSITVRAAGSQDAFRQVDKDYPLSVARLARQHGTPAFVLNSSSMGAARRRGSSTRG